MNHEAKLGYVTATAGAAVTVTLAPEAAAGVRLGDMLRMETGASLCFGLVGRLWWEGADPARPEAGRRLADVVLLGETLDIDRPEDFSFQRGVSVSPVLGSPAGRASRRDLALIYAKPAAPSVCVGSLHQDAGIEARVLVDELLGKHFAILGTTGSGKSCAVAVVLGAVLSEYRHGHVVLLDPHDEYAAAFGDMALSVTPDDLHLPYWLLNFEEMVHVLCSTGQPYREVEANILKEAVLTARHEFLATGGGQDYNLTIDTPAPFRLLRVVELLKTGMGRLDKPESSIPYLRLLSRIDSLRKDRRFAFMFGGLGVEDSMADIMARLLRLPPGGRPLTVINLAGAPSEIVDVVVSVLCRLVFDFALWTPRGQGAPVLLVCEEAHRYVPRDKSLGFEPTRKAVARIAKEGRKYGVSLGLVTQRPSEISESILSQMNTLFSMRMSNEADQRFVTMAMPENAAGLLSVLPSLRSREAVVVGEGVAVPMRFAFSTLADGARPKSDTARFSTAWAKTSEDTGFVPETIRRWRRQIR
jgi:DNA helicase HerA-like ATPase